MSIIDQLTELVEKSPPLYKNISSYYDRHKNRSSAHIFSRDTANKEELLIHGDYARGYAMAIVNLEKILAVVKAAEKVQREAAKAGPFMDDPLEESLCLLDDALAKLNEEGVKS